MVSKRQKEARKKFKEENPELFPKKEQPRCKDPEKKRKKDEKYKAKLKRKKGDNKNKNPNKKGGRGSSSSKHPLRVAGMKPGESCYICKAKDHIAKLCPEKAEWEKNKICLLCRRRGHSLKNCPNKDEETDEKKFCYNCGEAGHSLSNCPQPLQEGGTKFASCFICNERGHLSKNCPKNTHGIYPKGGSCKVCGGITHLARDCPNKAQKSLHAAYGVRNSQLGGEYQKPTRIKFTSGDDLDDDFMAEDVGNGSVIDDDETKVEVNPKKKQGPKVVNFFG